MEDEEKGKKSLALLLLILLIGGVVGLMSYLVSSGDVARLAAGNFELPGKMTAIFNPGGGSFSAEQEMELKPLAFAPLGMDHASTDSGKITQREDGFLERSLAYPKDSSRPSGDGNTFFESSIGMTMDTSTVAAKSAIPKNIDEAFKSGKLRFGPAATVKAKKPDPPNVNKGRVARAVSVKQSGLKIRNTQNQKKKTIPEVKPMNVIGPSDNEAAKQ